MTKEERQDAKQEQEALKSAKEIAKKKSKDKIQKVIWNAIKTAIIPMFLLLIKVFAIIFLVCAIASLFSFTIYGDGDEDDNSTSTEENYNSTVAEGGIDITSDTKMITEAEIQAFINNYDSNNSNLKAEMISKSNSILQWQNTYGYSAMFLITVAFEEDAGSDNFNFDTFLTEFSSKASEWKEKGLKKTSEIAKEYIGDDTASEWANNIENKMQKNAIEAGIVNYGEYSLAGDGYTNAFVSKTGKTYRNYKQNIGSYSTQNWCGASIVKDDGCSLIATTIIVSGYRNSEVNPLELASKYAVVGSGMDIGAALSGNGISYTQPFGMDIVFTESQKDGIKNYVSSGNPAIIKVIEPSTFTTSQHFMVLLDYESSTNEFYLSNPYTGNNSYGITGWVDADLTLNYCTRFYAIM